LCSVTQFWKNSTDAMTSTVRADGVNGASDYAYGTAMASDTCANVQWAWISLPAIVVLGVIVFLSTLMITSPRRREQPLWKSSALALVFTNLDIITEARGEGQLPTKTELDNVAKETKVRLSNGDWRPQLS
jgi:hypothetical protein